MINLPLENSSIPLLVSFPTFISKRFFGFSRVVAFIPSRTKSAAPKYSALTAVGKSIAANKGIKNLFYKKRS